MRIAIIGSGIAGLTAAHRLQDRHAVTIFEAGTYAGGHTHTVDVDAGGTPYAIDTGFIVFNHQHYPRFTQLLDELQVPSHPTVMDFSVRSERSGLEYGSRSLNAVFAQRRNLVRPAFAGMIRDVIRFNREAASGPLPDDQVSVGAYLDHHRYRPAFADEYLLALGASLWSCPPARFRAFSMRFVIEFLRNHALLQLTGQPVWRVVTGGSRRYVEALIARFTGEIRLGHAVRRVRRFPGHVTITDYTGAEATFDHVVLACHADQSLAMLADPSRVERDVLNAFPYQRNDVLLHTDPSVLPRSRRAWASWNYTVPAAARETVSVTYQMNRLQGLRAPHLFNVTLNDNGRVRPEHVLARFVYEHPAFMPGRDAMQRRHAELIDVNRTSFCGAYWGYGFHEDGVRSGLAVARTLSRSLAA